MNAKTKGIVSYLILAFGMAWGAWEIPIQLGLTPGSPLFQLFILPGAFAPAVSAVIVRKWITGEGFADAGLKIDLKKWRYFLFAWLLPVPVVFVIVGLAVLLGISSPDFSLQRFFMSAMPDAELPVLPSYIWVVLPVQSAITALLASVVLWGEEFGWRGYLQLRMFGQRPLVAAVTTGLIWGAWHYPINLRGYNYPDHPYLGLLIFPVSTIMLSIIFGWLRLKTGSIWSSSLAHSATNVLGGSFTMMLFFGGPNWLFVHYLGLLAWIPLGAVCLWIVLTGQLKSEVQ